jgi:hypothetical protein
MDQTMSMSSVNFTAGRRLCLQHLAKMAMTGPEISHAAAKAFPHVYAMKNAGWADGHLRWLRKAGFSAHCEEKVNQARTHRITDKGIEALKAFKA